MLSLDDVNSRISRYMDKQRSVRGRYSLRDLSKEIGYSIQQISDVRRGRRSLKSDFAERVKVLTDRRPEDQTNLTSDQMSATRDLVHYHIMSLSRVKGQSADPAWIAERLGISLETATAAFERLLRLGMIRVQDGRYEQTAASFTTANQATTEFMRQRYQEHSRLAFRAFDEEPRGQRSFQARTFAIPSNRVETATAIIRRCLLELDELESPEADRVFTCFVQLFPVSSPVPVSSGAPALAAKP
jgi:uncharacterized protein (TIGR02147 family)